MSNQAPRIAVDIGGTFTDVVLEAGGGRHTAKVLTTPRAPEEGVIEAVGGELYTTSSEILISHVPISVAAPEPGTTVILRGRTEVNTGPTRP